MRLVRIQYWTTRNVRPYLQVRSESLRRILGYNLASYIEVTATEVMVDTRSTQLAFI